jgi:hypothetical protein
MVQPIALCIEYLDTRSRADRYLCCVATPGYDVALGLDDQGAVVWRDDRRLAHELWVSADQQLMVLRRDGRGEIVVTRAGRSLSLPFDKPVVLLDCDRIDTGNRRIRVHLHGVTEHVSPPEPLEQERSSLPTIAAAVALGASVLGCKPSSDAGEVPTVVMVPEAIGADADARDSGKVEELDQEPSEASKDAGEEAPGASSSAPLPPATKKPPIEVRVRPPKPVRPRDSGTSF